MDKLVEGLRKYYSGEIFLTQNGRSAEYLFLKSLNLPPNSNVVVQSFTCNAVVNPILWNGLEVRYADTAKGGFNTSVEEIERVMDENSKVIIFQHTFGISTGIEEVSKFAKERGIFLLEDCAHALGTEHLGSFGDGAIVSFGIDKVLPTIVGGALVVNNPNLVGDVMQEYSKWKQMSFLESLGWQLQPVFWKVSSLFGRMQGTVARLFDSLGLVSLGFERVELSGGMPSGFPRRMSEGIARMVLKRFASLDANVDHRRRMAYLYRQEFEQYNAVLWYPYLSEDAKEIIRRLGSEGYRAVDWYRPPVYPSFDNLEDLNYVLGSCPNAEFLSERVVALPTGLRIEEGDVARIVEIVKSVGNI